MSSESLSFDLTPSELSETQFQILCARLDPTLLMLDALCHRNKNQHRHSSWWRNVCILRRSIRRLLDDDPVKLRLDRVSWLAAYILPSSYIAFSQLLADSQFAQLGISLIAMLSVVYEALQPLLRDCASDDRTHVPYHSMMVDDAADINVCDMGVVIVRKSDSMSLSIGDSNSRSTKLFSCDDECSNLTSSKTTFGHEKDTVDFDDIFKATQNPHQITEYPLLTMDDKFGQQTSVSKKNKSRSSSHRDISGTQTPAECKTKQEKRDNSRVEFDDIFEFVSVSNPNKKRAVSSKDVITPKSSKKKKDKIDKASETLGFNEIFGDSSKKDKKKTKSRKKSDISDIFAGL